MINYKFSMFNYKLATRKRQLRGLPGQTFVVVRAHTFRAGFTLVEILVVMGIIAMMSTLAVNGYMSYRRTALLDLGADNLVSQIGAMKAKATYGSNGTAKFDEVKCKLSQANGSPDCIAPSENEPKCYGVVFEKSDNAFVVKSFNVNFGDKKVWNLGKGAWEYDGCGKYDAAKATALELDSQLKIFSINGEKKESGQYSAVGPLLFRYLPPNGKLEVVDVDSSGKPVILTDLESIKFKVSYGVSDDENYQREIKLDFSNGKFSVNKIAK